MLACLTAAGCANRTRPQPAIEVEPTVLVAEPTPTPTPIPEPTPTPPSHNAWFGHAQPHSGDMHAGRVALERNDDMVYATLRVPLADMLNSPPQAPAYAVHIPESFQPGYALAQTANGNPIGLNAHTARAVNATFDVQVDPDGDLRFSVRSEGGADNAADVWLEARLVWPLRTTHPRVCERDDALQLGILDALREQGHGSLTCDTVTWRHLSSIHTLPDVTALYEVRLEINLWNAQVRDLHGLTGLTTLDVVCDDRYESYTDLRDVLVQLPNLEKLSYRCGHLEEWPHRGLASVPNLVELDVYAKNLVDLSAGWLDGQARLTNLTLAAPKLSTAPAWLGAVPGLRSLDLRVAGLEDLTVDWLQHTPLLTRLGLTGGKELTQLPGPWLARLTHLELYTHDPTPLPDGFLAHAPRLTHLEFYSDLESLPDDFLSDTPQLTHVSLLTPHLTALPPRFLAQAPQLKELELKHYLGSGPPPLAVALTTLPEGFLAHTPRLVEAVLYLPEANALPAGFLSHTPRLQHLTLEANRSAALPEGFLAQAPDLRYLHLRLFGLGPAGPPDFLQHVPALVQLYLWAEKLTALPAHFLEDVPRLRELHLWLPQLDPPPAPGEVLWRLLQAHSEWRRAAGGDIPLYGQPEARDDQVVLTVPAGTRLRVVERIRDRDGQEWLPVRPDYGSHGVDPQHIGWLPSSLTEPSVQDRCVGEYLCYYPGGPGG